MADTKTTPDDVQAQVKQIREDITTLTKLLKELAEDKAGTARDSAIAEANALLGQTREAADRARARAHATAGSVEDYIAEKPVQSALIALVAGIAIGLFSRR